jgi:uncharacterized ion transporter superfamily protein YfcC
MRKYLTREQIKENRMSNRITIGIALLTIISAATGFIIRGSLEKKYFQPQEPPKQHRIDRLEEYQKIPNHYRRPRQKNYTPEPILT